MTTKSLEMPAERAVKLKKLVALILLFALIIGSIVVIRSLPPKESEFVDSVAGQIEEEMVKNQIVLSAKPGRRTVAEFKEPILLTHGKETSLIVHTARLSETVSIASEGLGGWEWTSIYQDIVYEGEAQYTVDLSQLSEEDFLVNNEQKILTVRIPYAVLSSINIPSEKMKFMDAKKGWAAVKEIKLTPEQNAQLQIQATNNMKAKLIDGNIIAIANESAKIVVSDLLSATVHAVDPEFTVVIVQ